MEMEKNKISENGGSSSHSWRLDSHIHPHPHQSQWLLSTLSELEEKVKRILEMIEDDGETFAKRAEMFYKRKPQLIQYVEDLHRSYRALAEKYCQLMIKSESSRTISSMASPSTSHYSKNLRNIPPPLYSDSDSGSVCDQNSKLDSSAPKIQSQTLNSKEITHGVNQVVDNDDSEKLIEDNLEQKEELVRRNDEKREIINGLHDLVHKLNIEDKEDDDDDTENDRLEKEKKRDELGVNVSKLIEDNLEQKAELIRRNEEKREIISGLRDHITKLTIENKELKSCLSQRKANIKRNQSHLSRMKSVIMKKLKP